MTYKAAVLNSPTGLTANGAATFVSSGDSLVDLFSAIGSSRGKDITALFDAAYAQDRKLTLKTLLWARDVRGGAGERQTFRNLLLHMEKVAPVDVLHIIPHIAHFGRADDLLIFQTAEMQQVAFEFVKTALDLALFAKEMLADLDNMSDEQYRALLVNIASLDDSNKPPKERLRQRLNNIVCTGETFAKWLPRKGQIKLALVKHFGMTERAYRKMLVGLSDTVEQKMCARQWNEIDFSKIPSLAAARYQKAFTKRAKEAYDAYKASLADGTAKINAGAVYPYNVLQSLKSGDATVAMAQWDALPNYLGDDNILPMVDVSGSMDQQIPGSKKLTCMDVAVSLGLYVADKQAGGFKDMVLTFSTNPVIQVLTGNLAEKYNKLVRAHWQMSTNIEAAFNAVLNVAVRNSVPQNEMPKILLILSDMEFNSCISDSAKTNYEVAKAKFENAGYQLPRVVFWNLNARMGNSPVTFKENGTALISGFSPAIMKSVLSASVNAESNAQFTAQAVMLETLAGERYDVVDSFYEEVFEEKVG